MAPSGPAVELGVYKGGSLSAWCGARRFGDPVYAVDTWAAPHWSKVEAVFQAHMDAHALCVTVLKMNSWEAAAVIPGPIAFCFVDSAHDDTGAPYDVQAWPPCIMPGGIIVFHDYGVAKPTITVKANVDAWHKKAQWLALGVVGSAAAYMRPRGRAIGGMK